MLIESFLAAWYRGVVLGKIDNNYQIMFIDFGNTDVVDVSNIRKLPDELKDIPVLGIFAELNSKLSNFLNVFFFNF